VVSLTSFTYSYIAIASNLLYMWFKIWINLLCWFWSWD